MFIFYDFKFIIHSASSHFECFFLHYLWHFYFAFLSRCRKNVFATAFYVNLMRLVSHRHSHTKNRSVSQGASQKDNNEQKAQHEASKKHPATYLHSCHCHLWLQWGKKLINVKLLLLTPSCRMFCVILKLFAAPMRKFCSRTQHKTLQTRPPQYRPQI